MIELEVKYQLSKMPSSLTNLLVLESKVQNDIYYDTNQYDLIKKGNFLRLRNNKWMEFKIDLGDESHLFCKETSFRIDEVALHSSEISSILESLGIPKPPLFADFNHFVVVNGFQIIAHINKKRSTFLFGDNCKLSIDEVNDLGWFLEAEILIEEDSISPEEANDIKTSLVNQLIASEILTPDSNLVNIGYVELYLLKHNLYAYELGKFKN